MNNDVLARNILIHQQITEIFNKCNQHGIKAVLLKGAALIELIPEYSFERDMEDVDVLVERKHLERFRKILHDLGYYDVPGDPNAMFNPQVGVKIDIMTELWYLTKKQNIEIFLHAEKVGDFYVLPPSEMVKHIFYHMYFEHNYEESKWVRDLKLLKEKFGVKVDFNGRIPALVKRNLNNNVYYKGHILEFFLLPFNKKLNYVIEKLFPSWEFLVRRYNFRLSKIFFPMLLIFRLADLSVKILSTFSRILVYHLLKPSLRNS